MICLKQGKLALMRKFQVRNLTKGIDLAAAAAADTSKERRTGLLKHDGLREGEGLWIVPCEAVHTFGMKFAIDVVFLDKSKKVLKIRPEMPRRRISGCLRAHSVLELRAGACALTKTQPGDQLRFELVREPVPVSQQLQAG
jgi:uncharacterized protein